MSLVLTNTGNDLLALALDGTAAIHFTSIAIGSGANAGTSATALSRTEMTLPIERITTGGIKVQLTTTFNNNDVQTGFRMTELGVFARDPDDGSAEILYAYEYTPSEQADYVPAHADRTLETGVRILVYVGDAADVTAEIASGIYATRAELVAHYNDANAHANLYIRAGQKSGTTLGERATAAGKNSKASAKCSAVCGGEDNEATGVRSFVGGGAQNKAKDWDAFVGAGDVNEASGSMSAVVGGADNEASGGCAFVGGGGENKAGGPYSTVCGGKKNLAGEYDNYGFDYDAVCGGYKNKAIGSKSFIGGGEGNEADGYVSVIGGGYYNKAEGQYAAIPGGRKLIANHESQFVAGEFNTPDPSSAQSYNRGNYVIIVGNGTAENARSNALTLDWLGNMILSGKLTLGAAPSADMDAATKAYADSKVIYFDTFSSPTVATVTKLQQAYSGGCGVFAVAHDNLNYIDYILPLVSIGATEYGFAAYVGSATVRGVTAVLAESGGTWTWTVNIEANT